MNAANLPNRPIKTCSVYYPTSPRPNLTVNLLIKEGLTHCFSSLKQGRFLLGSPSRNLPIGSYMESRPEKVGSLMMFGSISLISLTFLIQKTSHPVLFITSRQ